MKSQRLKVLIVAHEFSPFKGSECGVGWNLITRIAKYHDITVLYASGSQFRPNSYVQDVNNYFSTADSIPGLTIINIDQPVITRFISFLNSPLKNLSQIGLPFLYYTGYKFWQKEAFRVAKRLHKTNHFDIVHQLTQITFREPGYMWKLGVPFVWGPTGNTTNLPKEFYPLLSFRGRIMERLRSFSNNYQFNYTARVIKANKRAALIYAFSNEDAWRFRKRATGDVKIMLDVGTYDGFRKPTSKKLDSQKLKGIWCGQFSERKAPSILLQALAKDPLTKDMIDILIVGSGPLREAMFIMANSLQLHNIRWIENVSHDEIFTLMGEADFFVHTSLREATSSVLTEALTMGIPVICHDANGMSIAINETCGIKIPLASPEVSINGFHEAMKSLTLNRNLLEELKSGATKRSPEISWDSMAEIIANDYQTIVN
ncbi:MAG: glycosyltransferase family 4 protein [Lentimicrobiaceae bacterium]|jgi:glycosyltransferase involved in cell wall biosynthesis